MSRDKVSSKDGDKASGVSTLAAVTAGSHGRLIKRGEAARMLGVSVSTLRRREGELVKPVRGPDGVHLFEESEIRSVMVTERRRVGVEATATNGGVAAEVFELLDADVHPVDIVKRLRLPPAVVTSLRDQWAQMRDGFVVTSGDAALLAAQTQTRPATSGGELAAQVRKELQSRTRATNAASPVCALCAQNPSCVCEPCLVERRGPLVGRNIKAERRTAEGGNEEVRIAAFITWDDAPFEEGARACIKMTSEWYKKESESVAEFVAGIENVASA